MLARRNGAPDTTRPRHANGSRHNVLASQLILVVAPVPGHKALNARAYTRRWPVPNILYERINVRKGVRHVARLQGQQIFLRCHAQSLLDSEDIIFQIDRLVIANIVDPPRR